MPVDDTRECAYDLHNYQEQQFIITISCHAVFDSSAIKAMLTADVVPAQPI